MKIHNKKLSSDLESKERVLSQIEKDEKEARIAKEEAERKVTLYRERDKLENAIDHIKADMNPYEKSLENCFCNWQPWLFYFLGSMCLLCVIIIWACFFVHNNQTPNKLYDNIGTLSSMLIPICALFASIGHKYNTSESINRRRNAARMKWMKQDKNKKYKILMDDLSIAQAQLARIEEALRIDE